MATIDFKTELVSPGPEMSEPWALVTMPKHASEQLSSKSTTMVVGTINGLRFRAALEPNGKSSHWFGLDKTLAEAAGVKVGDMVELAIEPIKEWPEPKVPVDLDKALAADAKAQALWQDVTPMARWEWIRWLEMVKQPETRQVRPARLISMLKSGKRRPCCFNRAMMTPPKKAEII